MRIWEKAKDAAAFLFLIVVGGVAAALLFLLKLIPDRERKQREDASKAVQNIKDTVAAAHAAREVKTEKDLATAKTEGDALEKKAETDSVAVANQFIIDAMKDG